MAKPSHDEIRDAVREALDERMAKSKKGHLHSFHHIEEMHDDHAIVEHKGGHHKVRFKLHHDGNGKLKAKLGKKEPVQRVYMPMSGAKGAGMMDSDDDEEMDNDEMGTPDGDDNEGASFSNQGGGMAPA